MGSAIDTKDIKRFELTEVYSHPDAKVDIVLVHGLNGDPRNTWTSPNGVFWPTQLLPVTLKSAKARILVYGYNADVYAFGKGGASSDMLYQHAQTLLANLSLERKSEETSDNPIIWVVHSLGGLLVKNALTISNKLKDKYADDLRSIAVSTYGIIFLGTPHTGSDAAKWGLMLQRMVNALIPKKVVQTEEQLIKTLQSNNETLQNITLDFNEIYQNYRVYMVHEGVPTDLKGTKMLIVDQLSASPQLPGVQYYGIEATHSGMCKFESKNSPGYTNISGTIKTWVTESPQVIQHRREAEKQKRFRDKTDQAAELLGYYPTTPTPQASTVANTPDPGSLNNSTIMVKSTISIEPDDPNENTPFFIKPSGFRPNSIFVGRQNELADMHKMLFDEKRRSEGTSAILIQSLPGGGKTSIARQYVYEHKGDYLGGIFWVSAKSHQELAAGFWDIARKAVLKEVVDKDDAIALADPQQFIKMVKKWFNRRHQWLLVLDGIHFDDAEGLQKFIPDSTNSSLIYTSTEKAVTGDHHFMNPQIIKLPLLSAREAQGLLLLELDKKEPFSNVDLKCSMELVQAMGLLPVVIHAVAQRLKATSEPLSKFARSYASGPRLIGLGTYKAVIDQLEKREGGHEALSLVCILCFFSQHIPVEMISLGLKGLDVPVKASDPITGRSLDNTFRHLNLFALIDRNEPEGSMHSSQSSRSSRDMLADNVDVVRLHSVVQGYFIDTLNTNETLPLWLGRAVSVFCCSYDSANMRITQKTDAGQPGLVEDYRLYEIHGKRLQQHVVKFQKKYAVLGQTQQMLDQYIQAIQAEIERRTPMSSQTIAGGKLEAFQTSIFDRTSSSSDTAPETPRLLERSHPGMNAWGLDMYQDQHESPSSLTHDPVYIQQAEMKFAEAAHHNHFPLNPLIDDGDDGYDGDREGSTAMTLQPSQRTLRQNSPISPGGEWEVVKPRRPKRPERLGLHRTINRMKKDRYRDRAGSFRAVSAIDPVDPRVSHETAQGYLQRTSSRAHSRGRISGQSHAEVALTHITQTSPPPARGGGMIQDRRSSSQRAGERGRMMTGTATYASAVTSPTKDTISGSRDPVQPLTQQDNSSTSSFAVASLQKFPIHVLQPPTPLTNITPMPPYPPSPGPSPNLSYQQPFHLSDGELYNMPRRQENFQLGSNGYPSRVYPRMTGQVPVETSYGSSLPLKRDHPHDYYGLPQTYSESTPSLAHLTDSNPPFLSLSSPNIQRPHSNTSPHASIYYPGRPELSFYSEPSQNGGYTSQPMSRDPSGQSTHSNHSSGALERGRGRRRLSLAETEPAPQLPSFSPRIRPTSYQVYTKINDQELANGLRRVAREQSLGQPMRKSPRLGYVRPRTGEDWGVVEENGLPPPRRQFNPSATSFFPKLPAAPVNSLYSTQTHSASPSQHHSPFLPPQPQSYSAPQSHHASGYPSPLSQAQPTLKSFSTHPIQYPPPGQIYTPLPSLAQSSKTQAQPHPHTLPRTFSSLEEFDITSPPIPQGEAMGRSGSGGVRIGDGRTMIGFGDFPEQVDIRGARERVERALNERRLVRGESSGLESMIGKETVGLGIKRC
ncbi:hypothetical protein G7Y89_g285 [Cudoniella acicularis]|uniref:DUF676 domain-containing protein n=1 Tax=Cudoniella acicularis TaxID=354080 RepID=A0A8H4RXI0_9HELO|nr:hypothetical protein G7Y89_g285 [Cudoniella acicularis]